MIRFCSKHLLFCLIYFTFISCIHKRINYPEKPEIYGLATAITINQGETKVILSNYFNEVSKIDSVSKNKELKLDLSADRKTLSIKPADSNRIPLFSNLTFWIKGFPYSIPAKKTMKITKHFEFDAQGKAYKQVQLAGDFNNWNPKNTELKLKGNKWKGELILNPGRYSYQIVADGKWMLDPANPEKADNNIGGFNSVLNVNYVDAEKKPQIYTVNSGHKKLIIGFENSLEEIYAYWENYKLAARYQQPANSNHLIEIKIPEDAEKIERSYLRVWAVNKYGVSNDLFIPLDKGRVIMNTSEIKRDDKQAMIMYFMMVDRFNNGNKNNDKPVKDPEVAERANYWGGDIAGITAKVKDNYFTDLGINSLWISPVSQNPYEAYVEYPAPNRKYSGYHGYWPISSINIDKRFGTPDEFKELVSTAHSKGINIIMDYVSHHVHLKHPLYKMHPDWITKLDLPDGRKNIRIWDEQRLTTWFDTFLPTLDFNRPEVVEMESDSAIYWVKKYDIDGYRHDATKHVPEVFWRSLTKKIKSIEQTPNSELKTPNLFQIGETFGSRELIASYINSGEQDAQFDFNLYFDAREVFAIDKEPFTKLAGSLQESFNYYGTHNLMGNITGNHDLPRFISLASGALAFNEDDKEAGWKRDIEVKDPAGYKKLSQLTAFIMTIPGVPVIYYGDEIGMAGAGDPDNRRPMKFTGLNENEVKVKETAKKLIMLRRNNLALIYGDTKILEVNDKTFAYARMYFDDIVIVVFNKDNTKRRVSFMLPVRYCGKGFINNFGAKWEMKGCEMSVELEPYSFEIILNSKF